jgi:hypothetical protein
MHTASTSGVAHGSLMKACRCRVATARAAATIVAVAPTLDRRSQLSLSVRVIFISCSVSCLATQDPSKGRHRRSSPRDSELPERRRSIRREKVAIRAAQVRSIGVCWSRLSQQVRSEAVVSKGPRRDASVPGGGHIGERTEIRSLIGRSRQGLPVLSEQFGHHGLIGLPSAGLEIIRDVVAVPEIPQVGHLNIEAMGPPSIHGLVPCDPASLLRRRPAPTRSPAMSRLPGALRAVMSSSDRS